MSAFNDQALDLFKAKGIDPAVAADVDVVQEGDDLVFPGGRRRNLIGSGPAKVRQPPGKELALWWLGEPASTALLTEGETCALAAECALRMAPPGPGLDAVTVAAIPGAGFPTKRLAKLADLGVTEAFLAIDNDDAGCRFTAKAVEVLSGARITPIIVELPKGRDVADVLAEADDPGYLLANMLVEAEANGSTRQHQPEVDVPDGAALLDEIRDFIRSYVVLPVVDGSEGVVAALLALWVLHTWTFEASWATPYLRVVSAAPESAKTLLLEVLDAICRAGWHTVNPSVAVLYRKVQADCPTLLLDEMDNWQLDDRRDALAILNAGYKRGAKVPRCNERGDLQEFEVYCPKAYAGLDDRALVPTLLSRSITIRMETKRPSDEVEMWIAPDVEPIAAQITARCQTWAEHNLEALRHRPRPDLLNLVNRKAEVWWALLVIGEHVGGEWKHRAQEAARVLGAGGDETDRPSPHVQLLSDIRTGFGRGLAIFTEDLLAYLNGLEESPWGARRKGDGLDARGLAGLLRPFRIKPKSVRVGEEIKKGYHLDQFGDAFSRYLPDLPSTSVTSVTSVTTASHSHADVTDVTDVTATRGTDLPTAAEVEEIAREADLEVVDPDEPLPPGTIIRDFTRGPDKGGGVPATPNRTRPAATANQGGSRWAPESAKARLD